MLIRRKSLWKRIVSAPAVWLAHYRLLRSVDSEPLFAARVALVCTYRVCL
jgi:hypothetical protein